MQAAPASRSARPIFGMHPLGLLAFVHDLGAVALAWCLGYVLHFNFEIPPRPFLDSMAQALLWLVPLHAVVFWNFRLYRGLWRYASIQDLQRIVVSVGVTALFVAGIVAASSYPALPRLVLLLHPLLLVVMMGGSRMSYRLIKEYRLYGHARLVGEPVLVIGAGDAAAILLRDLARSTEWHVVGLLDDEVLKQGREINRVKVLGPIDSIGLWAPYLQVRHAIVALPGASAAVRRRAIEAAAQAGLHVLTVPAMEDLLKNSAAIAQVRQVELEDLLGRDQVMLDDAGLHALLTDKTVLITGAGGTIGAELARQIAAFEPRQLVFLEQSELALYQLEQEFGERFPGVAAAYVIGDVKNAARLDALFGRYRPQVVFHAAAYKHVPLMESDNAWEAVQNNVLGTLRTARAAQRHGTEKFVFVSTDKAVNPTNVMGATKRLAEMACQSLQRAGGTNFIVVRFGNVLGSTGSVIPKFREQIARGGPLTVTHPDILRYFMSVPEAAQLVMQAALMGKGSEIFALDMGEPVRIVDLARDMIRLSGFTEEEIRIVFTGLRPGEKLYEELLANDEHTLPTPHPKLRIAKARDAMGEIWLREVEAWMQKAVPATDAEVRQQLAQRVPEYTPSGVRASAPRRDLRSGAA